LPSSFYGNIPKIIEFIIKWKPQTILDIGVGFGKFGLLCREYMDVYDKKAYGKWYTRIDGIEVWPHSILSHHEQIYDNIYIGNCINVLPLIKIKYDVILMIDVLEHMRKKDGYKCVELIKDKCNRAIFQVPIGDWPQGAIFGNPYEVHISSWQENELRSLGDIEFFHISQYPPSKPISLFIIKSDITK